MADRLVAMGHSPAALRLVVNRVNAASFGAKAPVFDLDECIDTVGVQLLAVIPESRELQQAAAAGGALASACPAAAAGDAMARRVLGQRVPLTLTHF